MITIKAAKGFTLIELMVALVLGLIVSAAAIQIFTTGIISSRLQQANAEIQDSGIFGLDYVVKDLQLANYGNVQLLMNDQTAYGGVVVTGVTSASVTNANFVPKIGSSFVTNDLLSQSYDQTLGTTNNHWTGLSNITGIAGGKNYSDQLTIQFVAPSNMTNCEGQNVLAGDLVIQRYFLRLDTNGTSSTDYALACDANTPNTSPNPIPTQINGFGDAGQIIVPRVDHFHVLLGTQTSTGIHAYYSIGQYLTVANTQRTAGAEVPRVVSIQISVLVRSANNAQNKAIDPTKSFVMLDQTVTPVDQTTRFQRRVYSTTIALRNGMGDLIQ